MFRTLRITLLSLMTAAIVLPLVNSSTVSAEDGWESIFDGKTLEKWDGNPDFWSVRDGAITGQTTAEKPTNTTSKNSGETQRNIQRNHVGMRASDP